MRHPWLAALLVCSFFAGLYSSVVLAQSPTPERRYIEVTDAAAAVAPRYGSDKAPSQPATNEKNEKIEALRQAADRLEKTGLLDEAARLKERASALEKDSGRALLAEKVKQLDALQVEVDSLRKLTGRGPQILLKVQAIEVSQTKLRELGAEELDDFLGPAAKERFHIAATRNPAKLQTTIQNWKQLKIAKVLAEPTLVTISGRPAVFNSGGEFPAKLKNDPGQGKLEYKQFGTKVEMLPTAIGSDRVRIEMKIRQSELIDARAADSDLPPSLRLLQIDTSYECGWNEAIVIRGLVRQHQDLLKSPDGEPLPPPEEAELVVVVTPESVEVLDDQVAR